MKDYATLTAPSRQSQPMSAYVGRSFTSAARSFAAPSGTGRQICYGDRIQVRLSRVQHAGDVLLDFFLTEVNDLSEVYGELRHRTRGITGLTHLYIRNATRGWAFTQPFKLYSDNYRPAVSVTRPHLQFDQQPAAAQAPVNRYTSSGRRILPESIRLLFGDH
ncbi:MAG: hypothetical protein K2N88_02955 [Muribaculaceae bacterium]|nr:hypothetical protein [Muribaculaceae bacterium]